MRASVGSVGARRALVLCLACALVAPVGASHAAPAKKNDDTSSAALELFRKSETAYDEGRFAEAVELLNRAYALEPQPVILYNLGRAYESLGDPARAAESYERYLEKEPTSPDRKAIETRIATLRKDLAERAALLKQRDEDRRRAEAAEAARRTEAGKNRSPSAAPWIVAGLGGAVLGAGAVFGIVARKQHEDATEATYQADAVALNDTARTYSTIANVAFVAGGVATLAGITWGILDVRAKSTAGIVVGLGSLTVVGRF
jgi:tetratricopeptide (TPR) repeat protein